MMRPVHAMRYWDGQGLNDRVTLIKSGTPSPRVVNKIVSRSSLGVPSIRETFAEAKTAGGDNEWRCKYCELNVSGDISSGNNVGSISARMGPIGAGGG